MALTDAIRLGVVSGGGLSLALNCLLNVRITYRDEVVEFLRDQRSVDPTTWSRPKPYGQGHGLNLMAKAWNLEAKACQHTATAKKLR